MTSSPEIPPRPRDREHSRERERPREHAAAQAAQTRATTLGPKRSRQTPRRTLTALITLTATLALFPDSAAPGETDETSAVAAIEKIGGKVRQIPGARGGLEIEFHLAGRGLTDAGLAHVAMLERVASLNLRDTKITSAGLEKLAGLTRLRRLHLERTAVDDAGMKHLTRLSELEYLNLYATKITDASLEQFTGLKKLERLYVWQTGVTDAGVAHLEKALPELEIVRGVDLSKLPDYSSEESNPPKPKEDLKWIPVGDARDVPKSITGINTQVFFENKSGRRVKLFWISYGNVPTLYAVLEPGATRQQNTYSRNTWLITDESDKALGYFLVGEEVARAVIPKVAEESKEEK